MLSVVLNIDPHEHVTKASLRESHRKYTRPTSCECTRTIEKDRTSRDQSVGVARLGAKLQNFNMEEIGELLLKNILPCHGSPD